MPHRTLRRSSALALALVGLAVLAGCGSPAPTTEQDPASDAGFPRSVEHFRGSTDIPARPARIAALDSSYADAVLLLDAQLVAHTDYRGEGLPEYLGDDRERVAADATSIGELSDPSLEQLAAVAPDLIISAEVRHGELYEQMSSIAPTVFSQSTGPTWKDNIRLLGEAIGKEDLADAELTAYEERARKVGEAINAKHDNPVVSIIRFAGEPTARLYRTSSFSGIVLEDAGIARPDSQLADPSDPSSIMNSISPENLNLAEGDVIIVSTYEPDDDADARTVRESAEAFTGNPLWQTMEGRRVSVRDEIWMMPVSVQGAHAILDDLAEIFDVDPYRED
ncbi:iron-siderophore ABC transporter substrate-binding protein [Hoyosella sp. G463]|uniref:Iron-siderophore ABC transporter substrate-binding protein n=1 Tax=Lolliginicoccus lacisalsi TaxID=2742202 RepID=A0A927JBA2_9ACTN|nr:iron-siderophore ABC transporter substrate-binding protein [Lolliginicoccus lacisalsi]MBD8506024.1 iron-siderophore ABC transporter substrate-binding protein [Lolliginicoccus lacisalsi]